MTFHLRMVEARIWIAPVGVSTARAVSAVPGIAGAAVQAWPVVVAECIGIAVVAFRIIAWKDLSAGATGEDVSKRAGTIVRVGTRIAARACCWRSTRISYTVIDVRAGLAVAVETIRAWIAGEAGEGCRLVVASHTIEARSVRTAVRVSA